MLDWMEIRVPVLEGMTWRWFALGHVPSEGNVSSAKGRENILPRG